MKQNARQISGVSYPIEIPVSYEIPGTPRVSGTGRTQAISSDFLRIESDRPLAVGLKIRVSLAWPASLPNGTRLNLWIEGEIADSVLQQITVKVVRYEFRTRRPIESAPRS